MSNRKPDWVVKHPPKDELWRMKDGTLIPVCAMSEEHVRNALRMVIRYFDKLQQQQDDMDDAFNGVMDDFYKWGDDD